MAKEITKKVKVMIPAGQATPAPPLGPVLGQAGVPIGDFVNRFNDATQEMRGDIIPAIIQVYEDRTFDIILKQPAVSGMILKAVGIKSGSGKNLVRKVGKITEAQVREIAERKMPDLNANTVEAAMKIVEGTCRSMGVELAY